MKKSILAAGLALAATVGAANAASIQFSVFDIADFNAKTMGGIVETFETGYASGVWNKTTQTKVGTFDTLGGAGTGGNCVRNTGGKPCTTLALQHGAAFGQGNVVPLGGQYALSSNDTKGIKWEASTGSMFNRLVFAVRDATDQGTVFSVTAGGETSSFSKKRNGNVQLVVIDFDTRMAGATVNMLGAVNDGFSIDGATVADIAPVPLPAAGLLLVGGVGALGALRKRRRTAA